MFRTIDFIDVTSSIGYKITFPFILLVADWHWEIELNIIHLGAVMKLGSLCAFLPDIDANPTKKTHIFLAMRAIRKKKTRKIVCLLYITAGLRLIRRA